MDKLSLLRAASKAFKDSLKCCTICPRKCSVDRMSGQIGYCRAPYNPIVYSYLAHRGEEPPISGRKGSGTIFFSGCNMKCVYCQNFSFSQMGGGSGMPIEKLSETMLYLQKTGCHNINLVTPTHYVPQIIFALEKAVERGLNIPIAYNTSGYDSIETLRMLSGVIDIYMPDMRYSDNEMAARYSDAPDYVELNRLAVKEMYDQVGDLVIDNNGIAKKGIIIRLLSLPDNISGTPETLKFIKEKISPNTYLSVMSQYYPTHKAFDYKELSRGVTNDEYQNVVDAVKLLGLNNGWVQEIPSGPDDKFLGTNIKPRT